jgi:ABC-type multidrug transport system fused ATPase/permease subunit
MVLLRSLALTIALGFLFVLLVAPILMPIMVFATYIYTSNGYLSASTAFTTLILFNIVRVPFGLLPLALQQVSNAMVAVNRISAFLQLGELHIPAAIEVDISVDGAAPAVDADIVKASVVLSVKEGCFSWTLDKKAKELRSMPGAEGRGGRGGRGGRRRGGRGGSAGPGGRGSASSEGAGRGGSSRGERGGGGGRGSGKGDATEGLLLKDSEALGGFMLSDINLEVRAGQLVAIVGPVGSGKSSLLLAVIHEMTTLRGSIELKGKVSYAAQQPWILNRTLRDNCHFDTTEPMRKSLYHDALRDCCLLPDLGILPAGDQTEIGERGC